MSTRAGRSVSTTRPGAAEMAEPERFLPLSELAFALPVRLARTMVFLLHPGSTQPGRDGIAVPPMSGDWLQECAVDSGKHGDLL